MKLPDKKISWKVGLSNGFNFTEGKGETFKEVPGELSPWLKLQEYLKKENAHITSMCLVTEDNRTFNLPSAGNNPKFRMFQELDKPTEFKFFRAFASDSNGGNPDYFAVIQATYPNYKLELWVDETNPKNCWVLVK